MSATKPAISHTPGPWTSAAEVQQFDLGESFVVFSDSYNGQVICRVRNFDEHDLPGPDEEKIEDFDAEAQANGRLIAAAPDLLNACQFADEVLGYCVNFYTSAAVIDSIRRARNALQEALAKAAGNVN